jgi:hypothetical protein
MVAPTNFRELLEYLAVRPRVMASCDDPKFPSGPRTFVRYELGRLWFADDQHVESFIPINCRVSGSETGILIDAQGFTIEKFARQFRYDFVEVPT